MVRNGAADKIVIDDSYYTHAILPIRLLLRELAEELDMSVPSYDFSWSGQLIFLHLDGYEVSTRVSFRLPFSPVKARENLREGLLRFQRISDLKYIEDETDITNP